jgi:hypothetical protein
MEDSVLLIVVVSQQSGEFTAVPMDHCQVQRPKILVKWIVCKVVIDVEEEGVLEVLGRLSITDPIQFIYDKE